MVKKLELVWAGKDEPIKPEPRILIENPELSFSCDSGDIFSEASHDNMLIHGDNLLALKALEKDYTGKVKCIYIDPPYNTGNAFEEYNDNYEHSIWLNLIYPRLEILWKLLSDDGVIFIQLNDDEMNYCKILMDEICGRNNFINLIAVKTKNISGASGGGEDRRLKKNIEYLICYAKQEFIKFNDSYNYVELEKYITSKRNEGVSFKYTTVFTDLGEREYYKTIKDGSGEDIKIYKHSTYKTKSIQRLSQEENLSEIETYKKYIDRVCTTENAQTSIRTRVKDATDTEDNLYSIDYYPISGRNKGNLTTVYFVGKNKRLINWFKNVTEFKDGILYKKEKSGSLWDNLNWNNVNQEGGIIFTGGKKPEALLQRILELTTVPGDLVLDSFLGSGTTAAVAQKMGRRWIGIEMGDHAYTHCKVRLDKVISGEDKGGITKDTGYTGGGSYKFYELAPTLVVKNELGIEVINKEYNAEQLAAAVALHEGFTYAPDESVFWKQSKSSESSFLFVTTSYVTEQYLQQIEATMKDGEYLLIACKAFDSKCANYNRKITVKKIPQMLLKLCEFGKDDYSLNIVNPPVYEDEE